MWSVSVSVSMSVSVVGLCFQANAWQWCSRENISISISPETHSKASLKPQKSPKFSLISATTRTRYTVSTISALTASLTSRFWSSQHGIPRRNLWPGWPDVLRRIVPCPAMSKGYRSVQKRVLASSMIPEKAAAMKCSTNVL